MKLHWSKCVDNVSQQVITTDGKSNIEITISSWEGHSYGWEWEMVIDNGISPMLKLMHWNEDRNIENVKKECEEWMIKVLKMVENE